MTCRMARPGVCVATVSDGGASARKLRKFRIDPIMEER